VTKWLEGWRPYLWLVLLGLAVLVPGQATLPPLDRDESRFAQATRQMLETGDYVRIYFLDQPRHKKPVGIHWLQAASVQAFSTPDGRAIWPYRLPSLLAALIAMLATFQVGARLFDRPTAFLGAALLGGSVMLALEGHQAKTDAVLLACTVLAQGALARFYVDGRGRGGGPPPGLGLALLFWLAQGVGMLVKGPILPLISLLTLGALAIADRGLGWFRALRPLMGIPVAAAVVAPWLVAVSGATQGGFVSEAVKSDLLPKLLGAQESHGGFPGYYLVLAVLFLWPGSLVLWPALRRAWQERVEPATRFLIAWAAPAWIVFELVPTKLPHYVSPLYPALALLLAAYAVKAPPPGRWGKAWIVGWAGLGIALGLAVVLASLKLGGGLGGWALLAGFAAVAAALLGARAAWKGRADLGLGHTIVAGAVCLAASLGGVAPSLSDLDLSRRVAAAVRTANSPHPVAAAGYHEPSLVFLLGSRTKLVDGAGAAAHIRAEPGALAVVGDRNLAAFQAALGTDVAQEIGAVSGLNYSRGQRVTLRIYQIKP